MTKTTDDWIAEWLEGVASGAKTMSQRKLAVIEKKGISLSALRKRAKAMGGSQLLAASPHLFKVIC